MKSEDRVPALKLDLCPSAKLFKAERLERVFPVSWCLKWQRTAHNIAFICLSLATERLQPYLELEDHSALKVMKPRMIKEDTFRSFGHTPFPTSLKYLKIQISSTQLKPSILQHWKCKKPRLQHVASLNLGGSRRNLALKLVWGCPQLQCWALDTSHPTCQTGHLRCPGWKKQSLSHIWSPFKCQWKQ